MLYYWYIETLQISTGHVMDPSILIIIRIIISCKHIYIFLYHLPVAACISFLQFHLKVIAFCMDATLSNIEHFTHGGVENILGIMVINRNISLKPGQL